MVSVSQEPKPADWSILKSIRYEHLIAGISGGVISTIILHPLDLLKVRFAVNDGRTPNRQYKNLKHAVQTIYRDEGYRGFFKGVTPNVFGCGTSWGFYFFIYQSLKIRFQEGDSSKPLGPAKHMLAAAEAGAIVLAITNPIWVVKTRLCLQYNSADAKARYKGMRDCFNQISVNEGFLALYKGFLPGLLGVSHGAIQFMVYEELKNTYNEQKGLSINSQLGTTEYILFAAVSKLLAASITYPYQVIRLRLQDQDRQYDGFRHCVIKTYVREGWGGFYKGLVPSLLRVVPSTVLTFLVYENISYTISSWRKD